MDNFVERWNSNEKVINQIIKSLAVCKDDDSEESENITKAAAIKIKKHKEKLLLNKKKSKEKKIKAKPSPVVVADGALIFSKFDLVQQQQQQDGKKRQSKDEKLKKRFKMLKKQGERLSKLVESGETDVADKIRNESAWRNALEKAEGNKVFDDPKRLQASLKKHKKTKIKHAKEWAHRKKEVEKDKRKRQEKRERNINKKILSKKKNKKSKK
ncbi:surfeit locus protein 6 homolog [Panonychus citri]|uniref:surfeit locus protein 6 homolog n=1 Tax=Panonychus citri TaxID=50023 RepID=UPI0023076A00|nr:surfeit locus protein 6 homolog [Panonychus citri]